MPNLLQRRQLLLPIPRRLFTSVLLLFGCNILVAQYVVKGTVTDKEGSSIPFCTIKIKGTKAGSRADANGVFAIPVPGPVTLEFSATNFHSAEHEVSEKMLEARILLQVILQKSEFLSEVVVASAHGIRRESTAGTTLPGKTAGLEVKRYAAAAPTIRIRGASSAERAAAPPTITSKRKSEAAGKLPAMDSRKDLEVAGETEAAFADSGKGASSKRTSLLTAGELNDFKKWNMWTDYNAADFKMYSAQWQLDPTHRYSVQVQNLQFKPVPGQVVHLVNSMDHSIVWTAVTDNTGKAELWDGLSTAPAGNNLQISLQNDQRKYAAIPFVQGVNTLQIDRPCYSSTAVQIAFVVDATGSMTDEIDYLKEELGDILKKVAAKDPSLEIQTGAVFYRDHRDAYLTRKQAFSNDIAATTNFIQAQEADGGGDYPEAVDAALETTIDSMNWNPGARARILFLLMDAPPHDDAKKKMSALIAKAAAKGIRVVPVACSGTDKSTEFLMRSIALATNGIYLFLTDDSGIGEAHIKPTTDEFKVELLNDLLQRTIEQMCYLVPCIQQKAQPEPIKPFENPLKIKLFPNPTNGPVTIEVNKGLRELYVADFTGKLLMRLTTKKAGERIQFNMAAFPSGTYLVTYITNEGKSGAERLVLIH